MTRRLGGQGVEGGRGAIQKESRVPNAGGGVAPPPPLSLSLPALLKTIFQLGDRLAKMGALP